MVYGDYSGEVDGVLFNHSTEDFTMKVSDWFTQLILKQIKSLVVENVKVLNVQKKCARGFWSTRKESQLHLIQESGVEKKKETLSIEPEVQPWQMQGSINVVVRFGNGPSNVN